MTAAFEDKVIVISGAGKGLGRAYALYLAGLGASIVVNNRRHANEAFSSADKVVEEVRQSGGQAIADYSSVEDPDSGERMLHAALETFGRLDAVVANAGISEGRSFHKQSMQDFQRVIDINLTGTVHLLHPTFRHMYEQRHGCILVSTSVAGLYGEHGLPAYSASKAGLIGLMHSLSQEGAGHGIRVNALAPFAATQMTGKDLPAALMDQLAPDHVAPVVAWLISDQCTLNGETIITGAGRISRARIHETAAMRLPAHAGQEPASIQTTWDQLKESPLEQEYRGALEQFAAFIADK